MLKVLLNFYWGNFIVSIVQQVDQISGKIGKFDRLVTTGIWMNNSTYPTIYYNGSGVTIGGLAIEEYNKSCSGIFRKSGGGGFLSCE
ncbi:MAG: hypothetical protein AABX33_01355 [Nanoarchaeota archaeon]